MNKLFRKALFIFITLLFISPGVLAQDYKIDSFNGRISMGWQTSAYIDNNHDVYVFGLNGEESDNYTKPTKKLDNVKQICSSNSDKAGGSFMAVKEDNTLWAWGNNLFNNSETPKQIMDNVSYAVGTYNVCAVVKTNGSLYMWGRIDQDFTKETNDPKLIMNDVKSVSVNGRTFSVLKNDGTLWMWGENEFGQVGNGNYDYVSNPIQITENVISVSQGPYTTAAIKKDGSLYMWGLDPGSLIDSPQYSAHHTKPNKITDDVSLVSVGQTYAAFIKNDKTLWTWGLNNNGELGNGTVGGNSVLSPKQILSNVVQLSCGNFHMGIIKDDGTLWTWGQNNYGQLGDESITSKTGNPVQIVTGLIPWNSSPSTNPNPDKPTQNSESIYRLYNENSGEHLYTSDQNEYDTLATRGWTKEGIGWNSPVNGVPVYRLYSTVTDNHLFTTDTNEKDILSSQGWQIDNDNQPLFKSGGTIPIYRLYNEGLRQHLLTKDSNEYNILGDNGWNKEGVKLYALSESSSNNQENSDQSEPKDIPVTGITLEPEKITLNPNETYNLRTKIFPENATNQKIFWETSDSWVVLVNSDGMITADNPGVAHVFACAENGHSASCIVEVRGSTENTYNVIYDQMEVTVKVGESVSIPFRIEPAADYSISGQVSTSGIKVSHSKNEMTIKGLEAGDYYAYLLIHIDGMNRSPSNKVIVHVVE